MGDILDIIYKLFLVIVITFILLLLKISMSNFQKRRTGKNDVEVKNTKKHNILTDILFFVLLCLVIFTQ